MVLVAALALGLVAAACGTSDDEANGADATAAPLMTEPDAGLDAEDTDDLSIVVLGDSVAAGEGINYGYSYDYNDWWSRWSHWSGGTDDPQWQGDYQLCHDSEHAYGEVVAAAMDASLAKFACTGSTYDNGIVGERIVDGQEFRPAQFGDWATKTDLNAAYDDAEPDVVVITLGADDVHFVDIVTYCSVGYTDEQLAALASALEQDVQQFIRQVTEDVVRMLEQIFDEYGHFADAEDDLSAAESAFADELGAGSSYCTEENPGEPIEKLFWEPIDDGTVTAAYQDLVTAIKERGEDPEYGDGKVPEIVFTTYYKPLPSSNECLDAGLLVEDELSYLTSLQETLNQTLVDAVGDEEGVHIADISDVMDGHGWCTEEPWAYGLSVLADDTASQAPFHPTPDGQEAIAEVVRTTIEQARGG